MTGVVGVRVIRLDGAGGKTGKGVAELGDCGLGNAHWRMENAERGLPEWRGLPWAGIIDFSSLCRMGLGDAR